jgi:hypothetical protein
MFGYGAGVAFPANRQPHYAKLTLGLTDGPAFLIQLIDLTRLQPVQ